MGGKATGRSGGSYGKAKSNSPNSPATGSAPPIPLVGDLVVTIAACGEEDGRTALVCTSMAGAEVHRFHIMPGASPDWADIHVALQQLASTSNAKLRIVTVDGEEVFFPSCPNTKHSAADKLRGQRQGMER